MIALTNRPIRLTTLQIKLLLLAAHFVLSLSACSGGISGTGDGSTVIIPGEESSAGVTDVADNTPDRADEPLHLPQQLLASGLHARLANVSVPLSEQARLSAQDTIIVLLETRVQAYAASVTRVSADLNALQAGLTDTLAQCDSSTPCNSIAPIMNVTTGESTQTLSSIQYNNDIAGYFDSTLSYTRESGDYVRAMWSNDGSLLSLYADTESHITYSLEDRQQSTLTFRQWHKTSQTLTQAVLAISADNELTIEADTLNWYVKAQATEQIDTLYAISNTEDTVRREAYRSADLVLSETCDLPACVWQPDHALNIEVFDDNVYAAGNFLPTDVTSAPGLSVTEPVERFVVARSSNRDMPSTESLICGGTTVQNVQRYFCWTPLPLLEEGYMIFEEVFAGGNAEYRIIQNQ